jgi:putative NADPH-quinone reductase
MNNPNFDIDVKFEQDLLSKHDIIICIIPCISTVALNEAMD